MLYHEFCCYLWLVVERCVVYNIALLFVGRMNMCPREVSHFDCCKKEHVIEKKGWEMLA